MQKPNSAVQGDKRTHMGTSQKRSESKNDLNSKTNKDTILVGPSSSNQISDKKRLDIELKARDALIGMDDDVPHDEHDEDD